MIKRKILFITTGGTIAGRVASTLEGEITGDSFSSYPLREALDDAITAIADNSGIHISIDHKELCDMDSSNILPEHWTELSQLIKDEYDNFDGFIITHGTNTLGYTSSALSFALANLDKPVIITGSQIPAGMPGSDAILNLENSLRIAVLTVDGINRSIKGIVAVFGSQIITGVRVQKTTTFDFDAFQPIGNGSIGIIGRTITLNNAILNRHNSYLSTNHYRAAKYKTELICENDFDMRIALLTEFPGMDVTIFKTLIQSNDIKGIVLRAFGSGDPTERLLPILRELKLQQIPVVISTQAFNGNSNFQVNEPGQRIAKESLAIPAYDMSIESQITKLAWLLAKMKRGILSYDQLCHEMINDIRGEVNVIWEIKM